ncbi:MAG: taurine dioxygenase [Pseudomonadota bacterium]|jgi:alpha-ketoglutarate-dependent taurine dioxygenase
MTDTALATAPLPLDPPDAGDAPPAVDYRHFRVRPVGAALGGLVEGIDLSRVDEEAAADLRDALWRFGVLFSRGQHLDFDAHKRLARVFAEELERHAFGRNLSEQGHPEVLVIQKSPNSGTSTTTDVWHHDVTGREHPNLASVLQAVHVPFGADTMWASMSAAYRRLPDALKLLFLNLDIDHDTLYGALRHGQARTPRGIDALHRTGERTAHPAVLRHPYSGELCLFVGNAWSRRVRDCTTDQGELLLRLANDMSRLPEIQVRWQWRRGDVAIWDNFGTTHYGVTGDAGADRLLYRVAAWSPRIRPTLDRAEATRQLLEARS